jgi:(2R)-3-sulfolactate dehydrogenase (NADP+)
MSATETLTLAEAHELAAAALMASNTAPDVAESVAQALVAAEADGQSGHGLSRIPSYAGQARSGKVNGHAVPKLEDVTPALFRVDACDGFAYPAFDLVIEHLPERARKLGIAMAAVRRSHHFGQAGAHCEKLAELGLAAFVYGNAPASIAPWGGRVPRFGTNPIAFAAPAGKGRDPLVIDLAVSRVAKGKIMAAEKAGKSIPEGWALDPDGNPTTDASAAMAGTMIPIGEAKGAALAMMVEVMSAAMVGASLAFEAPSLFTPEGSVLNLGQTIIAIDPDLVSGGLFGERMETLLDTVTAEEGVRLPGSSRLAARMKATTGGLAIPVHILGEIRQIIAGAAQG